MLVLKQKSSLQFNVIQRVCKCVHASQDYIVSEA